MYNVTLKIKLAGFSLALISKTFISARVLRKFHSYALISRFHNIGIDWTLSFIKTESITLQVVISTFHGLRS